jgi:predicted Ser/Thr protein kinase
VETFRNNKNNEAFLDRIYIVKVPYCLRVTEEIKIYDKLIRNSSLGNAPCAPGTLKMMAQFAMLSRLKEPENSSLFSKMQVYDGENLKDTDPKAKSLQEYRDYAGVDEGMNGLSTRFAFKILSKVFNFDNQEVAANPVHLLYVLEQQIEREQFPAEQEQKYLTFLKEYLAPRYVEFIGKEIQTAYLESYRNTARTSSTATSPSPTTGFRTRNTAIRTPAKSSTVPRSMANWRKSKNRPAFPIPRTSATRSSTSCCGRGPTTVARTRPGPATKSCAR